MALFGRGRRKPATLRTGGASDADHLDESLRGRTGVEAFLEPRTAVTDTTVLLDAHNGEWTP